MDSDGNGKVVLRSWLARSMQIAHTEFARYLMLNQLKPTLDSTIEFFMQYIGYNFATLFEAKYPHKEILLGKQIQYDPAAHIAGVLLKQQIKKEDVAWQRLAQDFGASIFEARRFFCEYISILTQLDQVYIAKLLSDEIKDTMYQITPFEYIDKIQLTR